MRARGRGRAAVGALALSAATILLPASAGAQGDSVLWPERQRAFFQDGAQLLLDRETRASLLPMGDIARQQFIDGFLVDPLPETPENELVEGIERRRALVFSELLSFSDDRARLLFLHGAPQRRTKIDCGGTFKPLELWTYGVGSFRASESSRWTTIEGWGEVARLVLYKPRPDMPYRLWLPVDSKRSLYSQDMEYLMEQWEAYGGSRIAKSFDRQLCDETPLVDQAIGVLALTGFRPGRPKLDELSRFIRAPGDLADWSRRAAATRPPETEAQLTTEPVAIAFPRVKGQRMVTELSVTLPPGAGYRSAPDDDGDEVLDIVIESVLEQDGRIFEERRVRFTPPSPGDQPVALIFERPLRSGRAFLARLRVKDQIGGAETVLSKAFLVPRETTPVSELPIPEEVMTALGQDLEERRLGGRDSLLLVPPKSEVLIGLWRAQALVTGERIVKVQFLVDGKVQLTRARPPYEAEVRLGDFPVEQTIRAEGYDAAGELVAYDEYIINQPRGGFKVSILEPKRGFRGVGLVDVRAQIVLPDDRRVETVEFLLNDEVFETRRKSPWTAQANVPAAASIQYLAVQATLDDGRTTEAVRVLNSPAYVEEVDVTLIELYTTVVDRGNRPVRGLTQDEFTVLEEGREQEIVKFELVDNLPLTIGIVIDTSGSMASSLIEAQSAASGFLDSVMKRGDRCFVLGFSSEPSLLMSPTDDGEACRLSLEELQAVGWTTLHDAIVNGLFYFRAFQGQRAMVLLSDGDDTLSSTPFRSALEYARRSGVAVYTVGLNVGGLDFEVRGKLKELAEETGGRSFFIGQASELATVYAEIEEELRSRYLIAFASELSDPDIRYRQVEVKVKRRGLKARTARGYYP